ncbi:hypothetical protein [Candidatus Enterovibrio escicola]|uniref:Mobile element protein n=1 Tax=Candidatus Enterovibrio escicola TaxID=1927127 RepID=A0A2A5SZU5_9GAMM|nr:hypothetical protein [Candidatus Enterovibrio escacola]PCS21411.1 hypothetical protein BTN49_2950 [Candidatus Enterovibrio escacola]
MTIVLGEELANMKAINKVIRLGVPVHQHVHQHTNLDCKKILSLAL